MLPSYARPSTTRLAELVLWGIGALGAATAAIQWSAPSTPLPLSAGLGAVRPAPAAPGDQPGAVLAAAGVLEDHDPFRVTHRPATVAFGAPPAAPVGIGPPSGAFPPPPILGASRPHLTLLGIVGGRAQWAAVLAGVAGHDGGALVQAGDTLGGLRIRRVTADSLVVQDRDTVWHLTLGPSSSGLGTRP